MPGGVELTPPVSTAELAAPGLFRSEQRKPRVHHPPVLLQT